MEFSEFSKGLQLKPEYFPLDYIQRRAKIFAPSKMLYQRLSKPDTRELFLAEVTNRFTLALNQLASDGVLIKKDDFWKVGENFIEKYLQKESPHPDFIENFSKSARATLTNSLARIASPLQNLREAATKFGAAIQEEAIHFPDSRKFLPSEIPLKISDASIEEAIHDLLGHSSLYPKPSIAIKVTKIGEILNTVFLIETDSVSVFKKIIVKSYDNWIGLKWFPLSLWTAGLRRFSRIGRKRLANEFFMNRNLRRNHFLVPEIFGLDWDRSLLLEEFIAGTNIETLIRRIARAGQATLREEEVLEKIGRLLGSIHQTGFMLGDCKPENLILSPNNDIYIVDLEQASKATDPAWDLAVFLYFAGRYAIRKSGIQIIVRDVIKGYISIAPARNIVKATQPPYPNFLTPVTPLHIITEITKTCRKEILPGSA